MKRNKIILIVVLLLIIIGFSYFVVSSFNSHDNLNVINNITNSSLDINKSSNTTNGTLENDSKYSTDSYSSYNSYISSSGYSSSKSNNPNDEFTAYDARKVVKRYLSGVDDKDISDLKIGKPKFKDSDGSWLVPLYDKKTGKFLDSVYAYGDGMTHGGVDDYDNYKRVISGKEPKESKSNFVKNR